MQSVIDRVLDEGVRDVMLEHELLDAFAALGMPVPERCFIPVDELGNATLPESFAAERGVLKVVSPQILHKSDVGGVRVLEQVTTESVAATAAAINDALPRELREAVMGFMLEAALPFESKLGHELLIGMRQSPDFGPIYTVGFGGTYVEALAAATTRNQSTILYRPGVTTLTQLHKKLDASLFFRWATGGVRGVPEACSPETLTQQIVTWIEAMEAIRLAVVARGRSALELELNPLVFSEGRFVPVDALMRLGPPAPEAHVFPVENLRQGLLPKRVALIGVSTKMNMGRIILRSILEAGFDPQQMVVVREGADAIDGVCCVPEIEALPEGVDLLVLAVPAAAVPEVLGQVFTHHKAKTVLLIPGGMGETAGGKAIAERVEALLHEHRDDTNRPVLVGNNSVGLVCRPANFDSLFIPKDKLPRRTEGLSNVAFISQSGAFMLTQLGKLDFITPDFQLSVGNQLDARLSHFAEALLAREGLTTFAFYVEGLKPDDGEALAQVIKKLRAAGKDVVVYKAGRSSLGQAATMGHTASVAGDHRVFHEVLTDAGAMVVDRFSDFLDLVRLSAMLPHKRFNGMRAAFISNAGYETVGMADSFEAEGYAFTSARLGSSKQVIEQALKQARIEALVNVDNPLDLTPMANDTVHAICIEALLADEAVDLGVFGNVPYTPAVQSLPHGVSDKDVFDAPHGYAARIIALAKQTEKPFVVVVDAGSHYDPMCAYLQDNGVPCFRDADRAVSALGRYAQNRLSR